MIEKSLLEKWYIENDMTLDDLAELVPVTKNTISRYERGLYLDEPVKQAAFEEMFQPFIDTISK